VDLLKIIEAIDVHTMEHGNEENLVFDPRNSKLEQLVEVVRTEQSRCLDDLIQFNSK